MTPRSSCPGEEWIPLQGANLRLNYEINNVTDTALGNLARGKPSFCRSDRCLSYRPPGSLLESRGGSILARAEAQYDETVGSRHLSWHILPHSVARIVNNADNLQRDNIMAIKVEKMTREFVFT